MRRASFIARIVAAVGLSRFAVQARPAYAEPLRREEAPKYVAWLPEHPCAVEAQVLLDAGYTHVRVAGLPNRPDLPFEGPLVDVRWSVPIPLTSYVTPIESVVPKWRD